MMTTDVPPVIYTPGNEVIRVGVVSFGYLWHPEPVTAFGGFDITVDLRKLLHNPYHDPALRELTGLEQAVRGYVLGTPGATEVLSSTANLVLSALRQANHKGLLVTVAFGCAGGRHRSVVLANELRNLLTNAGIGADVTHYDVLRPVYRHTPRELGGQP